MQTDLSQVKSQRGDQATTVASKGAGSPRCFFNDSGPLDLKWIAGFFDGEGCVQLEFDQRVDLYSGRLQIAQKDLCVLEEIRNYFQSGSISLKGEEHGGGGMLLWYGKEAVRIAEILLPYSRCKHDQLRIFIEASKLPGKYRADHADLIKLLRKNIKYNSRSGVVHSFEEHEGAYVQPSLSPRR